MALTQEEIDKRLPLWEAISWLYVDNEIGEVEYRRIADEILKYGCSLAEAERIFRFEVAPVCWGNVWSWAVWSGFDTESLAKEIVENIEKQERSFLYRAFIKSALAKFLMTKIFWEDWEKVKAVYQEKKMKF